MGSQNTPHLTVVSGGGSLVQAPSDDALMALTAGGEARAFEALAQRHLHRVVSFCTRFVGNQVDGEELAQEVFVSLWSHRARYQSRQQFSAFLFTLAVNHCRNHQRWWRRWLRADEQARNTPLSAEPASALEALLDAERGRWLHDEVRKLSPLLREAVLLRFEQGLDYRAIGLVCGCSEGNARARVFRAVEQLRTAQREVSR
ncbi:MAG: RNA polymerase sigma factor [Myxococcaceae bacterium]|nr:RNA polymerase sigma factor [Myxococcaceae bacterium]